MSGIKISGHSNVIYKIHPSFRSHRSHTVTINANTATGGKTTGGTYNKWPLEHRLDPKNDVFPVQHECWGDFGLVLFLHKIFQWLSLAKQKNASPRSNRSNSCAKKYWRSGRGIEVQKFHPWCTPEICEHSKLWMLPPLWPLQWWRCFRLIFCRPSAFVESIYSPGVDHVGYHFWGSHMFVIPNGISSSSVSLPFFQPSIFKLHIGETKIRETKHPGLVTTGNINLQVVQNCRCHVGCPSPLSSDPLSWSLSIQLWPLASQVRRSASGQWCCWWW